ncbi:MAG: crossover junction endodeoxyribonuclease RuvC [Bacteroidota bacterium]
MTVLGVDPGTLVTGYGIVRRSGGRLTLVTSGTIRNDPSESMPQRLHRIFEQLSLLINEYRPDEFAIESAFYGKNAQSALKLGHARGVSMLAAVERNIPTAEYSPREVKKAVVGTGNASKEQVRYMVRSLLGLRTGTLHLDASDALAIAICHLHRIANPAARHRDWKSYIAAHPERVAE